MSIVSLHDWKEKTQTTTITTDMGSEDCANAFLDQFIKANPYKAIKNGTKISFFIPKDHNDISQTIVLGLAVFFKHGWDAKK